MCDSRRQKLEALCFFAGCLLALLACAQNARQRGASSPGTPDGWLAACEAGDSPSCNQLGEELWAERSYAEARDWFAVSCARLDDLVANASRLVELGAEARASLDPADAGSHPEGNELRARIAACVRVADTHLVQGDHLAAQPYFDRVCRLRVLDARVDALIADFQTLVASACNGAQFARQQAAAAAAQNAEVRGVLVAGEAPVPVQTRCLDLGKSCEGDPVVSYWKEQCSPDAWTQAPCYCAAAASYKCLIAQGCHVEAGGPSTTKLADLQRGLEENTAGAARLGAICP